MVLTRTDLEEIRKLVSEEAGNIMNEIFLNNIADKIIKTVSEKFSIILDDQKETICKLNTEVQELKTVNKNLQKNIDKHEQYSRNLNLRIFGVKEEPKNYHNQEGANSNKGGSQEMKEVREVLDLFRNKLKVDIKEGDIRRCHRVNAKNPDSKQPRPRAILVRFVSNNKRMLILKSKSALKSTEIQIREDLTKNRFALLQRAIKKYTHKNAWCRNGTIYTKVNGQVRRIEDDSDLI